MSPKYLMLDTQNNHMYKRMVSMLEAHNPSSLVQVTDGPAHISHACV